MVTKLGSTDRWDIPPEYMSPLRDLFCPSEVQSDDMFGAMHDIPVGERDSVEKLLDIYRRFAAKKYGWCDRGTGASSGYWGWGGPETVKGSDEMGYTLNQRWWDLLTLFPTSVADAAVLCERISSWVNTASNKLPEGLERYFNSVEDKVGNEPWFQGRREEYTKRKDACISAFKPRWWAEEEEYYVEDAEYKGKETLAEYLCLSAAKMLSPPDEEGSAPACTADQFECARYVEQISQLGKKEGEQKAETGPVDQVKEIIRKRLRGIPWHEWVSLEKQCVPLSGTAETVGWVRDGAYALYSLRWVIPLARGYYLGKAGKEIIAKSLEGRAVKWIYSKTLQPIGRGIAKLWRKIRPPKGSGIVGAGIAAAVLGASVLLSENSAEAAMHPNNSGEGFKKQFSNKEDHQKWVLAPLAPIGDALCFLFDCSEAY